ncbi:hypothetical protein [Fervidobacterium sp.]
MDTKDVSGKVKPLATLGWKEKVMLALGMMGLTERRLIAWSAVPLEESVLMKLASTKDPTVLAGLLGKEELTSRVREQIYRSIARLPEDMEFWDVEKAVDFFASTKEEQERTRAYYRRYRGELLNALLARCEMGERPWKFILKARLPERGGEELHHGSPSELLGKLLEVPNLFPRTLRGLFAHPDPKVVKRLLALNLPTADKDSLPSTEDLRLLLEREDFHLFAEDLARLVGKKILPLRSGGDEDSLAWDEFLLEVLEKMREAHEAGAIGRKAYLGALRKLAEEMHVSKKRVLKPWTFLSEEAVRMGDFQLAKVILERLPEEQRPPALEAWVVFMER